MIFSELFTMDPWFHYWSQASLSVTSEWWSQWQRSSTLFQTPPKAVGVEALPEQRADDYIWTESTVSDWQIITTCTNSREDRLPSRRFWALPLVLPEITEVLHLLAVVMEMLVVLHWHYCKSDTALLILNSHRECGSASLTYKSHWEIWWFFVYLQKLLRI